MSAKVEQSLIAVDDIDGGFVASPVPGLLQVEIGADLVLIATHTGQTHTLNPTASLVWRCFDGEGTLDEVIGELSDATGAPVEVVATDVMKLVRDLAERDLLEGVATGRDEDESSWTPPERIEVGKALPDFTLPDLDGSPISLSSLLGRQLLLVNWSPRCGFCTKIAGELGGLGRALDEHGVDMAFVTDGDDAANRRLFAEAGIDAPALLKQDGLDPFHGWGTPVAYLLSRDGIVAAPMAHGAFEVPVLVRELAGLDPSRPAEDHVDENSEVGYLAAPGSVCGPGGGAAPDKGTEWAGTRAYAIRKFHIGVRYNSLETAELLDRLLLGRQVDDPRTPDNFSVALYSAAKRQARELNLLVKGGDQLVRSRSGARVLHGLLSYLSAALFPGDPALMYLNATPAVRDGAGLLLPPGIVGWVKQLQPRLARRGIQLVDAPLATVDPVTRELVVVRPAVDFDESVLEDIDDGVKLGSELPRVQPGRYPLQSWYLVVSDDHRGPLTRTLGFASAVGLVAEQGEVDMHETVRRLLAVIENIETRGLWYSTIDEFAHQVEAS